MYQEQRAEIRREFDNNEMQSAGERDHQGAQIADLLQQRGVVINRTVGHMGWLLGD